jgi:hypothetical protein
MTKGKYDIKYIEIHREKNKAKRIDIIYITFL